MVELMGLITLVIILYIVVEWVIPLGKKMINSMPANANMAQAYTTRSVI